MWKDILVATAITAGALLFLMVFIAIGQNEGEEYASKKICNETQWKSPSCVTLKNELLGVGDDN